MTQVLEKLHILVRIITVFYSIIPDCDEVFNYYEPLNFLVRGFGKQTWEYSPEYAIRSWAYLLPYSLVISPISFLVDFFQLKQSITFYAIRLFIVSFTIYAESHLYKTLKQKWNNKIANWYLFFTTVSTGYSHAGVALLPSSLAMNCVSLATSNFIKFTQNHSNRNALLVTSWFSIGGLFGWPFALVLAAPSSLYIFAVFYNNDIKRKRYFLWSVTIFFFYLVVVMEIDYHYYEKSVVVPLNIVLYNVINASETSGPNIFGTEPLSYYLINLLLNFNVISVLAYVGQLIIPLVASIRPLKYTTLQLLTTLTPLVLWSAIFFSQPHKEERFLYPIYPLINLSGAITSTFVFDTILTVIPSKFLIRLLAVILVLTSAIVSVIKTASLSLNYSAPLSVYSQIPGTAEGNLCVSREWYRYPSSFFLPSNLRLKFVSSNFNGLLPGDFDESTSLVRAISKVPENMNNQNLFDASKLVEFDQCNYFIDIDQPVDADEIELINTRGEVRDGWKLLYSEKFLNNEESEGLGRLLYLPESLHEITKTKLVYHNYNLYYKESN